MNYQKKGLQKLLKRLMKGDVGRLVLTHKDRLLRFGAELVFAICEEFGTEVNTARLRKSCRLRSLRSRGAGEQGRTLFVLSPPHLRTSAPLQPLRRSKNPYPSSIGTEVIIINQSPEEMTFEQELVSDLIELVTVFSARLYGARSRKNKKLIEGISQVVSDNQPEKIIRHLWI